MSSPFYSVQNLVGFLFFYVEKRFFFLFVKIVIALMPV